MYLDHANIVTPDLATTVSFFTEVVGLTLGPRPDFRVPGSWLYSDGRPVIHLTQATIALPSGRTSPRIDHVALRASSLDEWAALLGRLKAHHIDYQINAPDDDNDIQLWVTPAPGLTIEIIVGGNSGSRAMARSGNAAWRQQMPSKVNSLFLRRDTSAVQSAQSPTNR